MGKDCRKTERQNGDEPVNKRKKSDETESVEYSVKSLTPFLKESWLFVGKINWEK